MNKQHKFSLIFILLGLLSLMFGGLMGVLSSIIYLEPTFLKSIIPFNQLRPLHTTSVVSWLILSASGGIYYYISEKEKLSLYKPILGKIHLSLFIFTGIGIYTSFLTGKMGGREYFEFYPLLIIPIIIGWILFAINYFNTLLRQVKNWPVYYWMWGTGLIFMIYHLMEAHFWLIPSIREHFIKDISIQWKSYGSFVGSWNLLIYGTAIYLMAKIKNDDKIGRGKESFFFYFLGLTNLMFNWAHHTYFIPSQPWVRVIAYIVSMTEWVIFIHIVYNWKKSLSTKEKKINLLTYQFIMSSDLWVFLNLTLALFMSIPAFNYFSHGTLITVAHSMGTTIGINTSILFASVSYIASSYGKNNDVENNKSIRIGYKLFNSTLFLFWTVLILAGITKAIWNQSSLTSFSTMHTDSYPIYIAFVVSGLILLTSIYMIAIPLIKVLIKKTKD